MTHYIYLRYNGKDHLFTNYVDFCYAIIKKDASAFDSSIFFLGVIFDSYLFDSDPISQVLRTLGAESAAFFEHTGSCWTAVHYQDIFTSSPKRVKVENAEGLLLELSSRCTNEPPETRKEEEPQRPQKDESVLAAITSFLPGIVSKMLTKERSRLK